MKDAERREVRRYLGYGANAPDERVEKLITDSLDALTAATAPRSVFRACPLRIVPPAVLEIADFRVESQNLARNLDGCTGVYLMAATLGVAADRLLARVSARSISDAVVYQAAAAALLETYCDEVNDEIRRLAEADGLYCRPRFSPGYGDFPLEHQRDFIRLLDTPRKIGLSVTDACQLVPVKSVTAVIGLSDTPQPCPRSGCETCDKTDCAFRR